MMKTMNTGGRCKDALEGWKTASHRGPGACPRRRSSRPALWLFAVALGLAILWPIGRLSAATNTTVHVVARTNPAPPLRPGMPPEGLPGRQPGLRPPTLPGLPPPTKVSSGALPVPPKPAPGPAPTPARLAAPAVPNVSSAAAKTNSAAASSSFLDRTRQSLQQLPTAKWFYPALGGVAVLLALIGVFALKPRRKAASEPLAEAAPSMAVARLNKKPLRPVVYHSCNVLSAAGDARHLFHFDAKGGAFKLEKEQTGSEGELLPAGLVGKEWTNLWQAKLNIALLPSQHVFLRVAQFPRSEDYAETISMVELQLEKLSPMPVAQIVWSLQIVPHAEGNLQTVIVIIAARNAVEEYLGQLEGQGFLADRLEVSMLDQLLADPAREDGAWIYPDPGQQGKTALVAWWNKGVLQNLDFLFLPADKRAESLKEQLLQMAWAGELEGWLNAQPKWHLVADAALAADWEPALRSGLDQPVQLSAPLPMGQLAALTGRRAAQAAQEGNLLPAEFSVRYQQQFVDRLWMRALGGVAALYVIVVLIYACALTVITLRTQSVESQVAATAPAYTNAIQLRARFQVLKDRQELKFAALDCYRVVAEQLPADVTLDGFNFSDGKKLTLNGTAPSDKVSDLLNWDGQIRKAQINGQMLFDPRGGDNLQYHASPNNSTVNWNCSLELARSDVQ